MVVRPGSGSGAAPGPCLHPGGHRWAVSTGGRCRCLLGLCELLATAPRLRGDGRHGPPANLKDAQPTAECCYGWDSPPSARATPGLRLPCRCHHRVVDPERGLPRSCFELVMCLRRGPMARQLTPEGGGAVGARPAPGFRTASGGRCRWEESPTLAPRQDRASSSDFRTETG